MSTDGLTPNQALALQSIRPGHWFHPDESNDLILVHSRFNTCRILASKRYLVSRVIQRNGFTDLEFMLPLATAVALNLESISGRTA